MHLRRANHDKFYADEFDKLYRWRKMVPISTTYYGIEGGTCLQNWGGGQPALEQLAAASNGQGLTKHMVINVETNFISFLVARARVN